jgi:hypothetical protein
VLALLTTAQLQKQQELSLFPVSRGTRQSQSEKGGVVGTECIVLYTSMDASAASQLLLKGIVLRHLGDANSWDSKLRRTASGGN